MPPLVTKINVPVIHVDKKRLNYASIFYNKKTKNPTQNL